MLIIVGANGERFSAAFTDSVHFVLIKSVFLLIYNAKSFQQRHTNKS